MRDLVHSCAIYSVGAKNYLREDRCQFLYVKPEKKKYIEIRQNTPFFAILVYNIMAINQLALTESCRIGVITCILRQISLWYIYLIMSNLNENKATPNNNGRCYAFLA